VPGGPQRRTPSAYVSTPAGRGRGCGASIRQHTSAYVPGGPHRRTPLAILPPSRVNLAGSLRYATMSCSSQACHATNYASAYVSIRQHTSAYVSIRLKVRHDVLQLSSMSCQ
jgi:hypothetical protein